MNGEFEKSRVRNVSLDQARSYLAQLDLGYIIAAMCSERYPLPRWIQADAVHCCQLYKNFLFLQKKYSSLALVPTREIDEFWHNHILHTRKYMQDCMHIFGYYRHHDPAMPGEDLKAYLEDFIQTKQLYLKEFNQSLDLINN